MLKMKKILAKPVSYDSLNKRDKKDVKFIVIHYTGNSNDTTVANLNYFANGNTRAAGAHFFVDSDGVIGKSINMNRTAWAVGGFFNKDNGAGSLYRNCTNHNSVSIELCNCTKMYTKAQAESVKKLIRYIRKHCPNAKTVVRHWDVNGKSCPAPMIGTYNSLWKNFLKMIGED